MTAKNSQQADTESGRRGRKPRARIKTSIGISPTAYVLWNKTAEKNGLTAIMGLEVAVREWAQQQGIEATPEEIEQAEAMAENQKKVAP